MKCAIKYNFPIHDINKFILFLRKDVYPFEYIDDWKIFNESLLPGDEDFYSHSNDEGITDVNQTNAKWVGKDFEIKTLREHYGLYVESDVLLLADVLNNFEFIWLEKNGLGPAHFRSASELAWEAALKITKVNLYLLNEIFKLLNVWKGTCHELIYLMLFISIQKLVINTWKIMITKRILVSWLFGCK